MTCDGAWPQRLSMLFDLFRGFGCDYMTYEDIVMSANITGNAVLKVLGGTERSLGEMNTLCESLADDAYTKVFSKLLFIFIWSVKFRIHIVFLDPNSPSFFIAVCIARSILSHGCSWWRSSKWMSLEKSSAGGHRNASSLPALSLLVMRYSKCTQVSIDISPAWARHRAIVIFLKKVCLLVTYCVKYSSCVYMLTTTLKYSVP